MTRRFLRPPPVAEYERMTQALRIAAAEHVAAQLEAVNARRSELATPCPPAYTADELTADEVRAVALAILPRVQRLWPDPPEVQASRRATLLHALTRRAAA